MLNFSSARIKKKTFNKLGKYDQKFWTLLTDVSEARLGEVYTVCWCRGEGE